MDAMTRFNDHRHIARAVTRAALRRGAIALHDEAVAENTALIRLWRAAVTFNAAKHRMGDAGFASFAARACLNGIRDLRRDNSPVGRGWVPVPVADGPARRFRLSAAVSIHGVSSELLGDPRQADPAHVAEVNDLIDTALRRLPANNRRVMRWIAQGYSQRDTAKLEGKWPENICLIVKRSLPIMRRALERDESEPTRQAHG